MKKESSGRWSEGFLSVAVSIVIVLIVGLSALSLYRATIAPDNEKNIFGETEVIAVAIGLLVSILFIERWRSLESKVDRLSIDQRQSLDYLEKSFNTEINRKLGNTVRKAEALTAQISEVTENHPWLEEVSDREILIETDSIRGILRTCYSLLRDDKILQIYEYLEYNSKKGTISDPRPEEKRGPLRGTPDDFIEIAEFCEIWLEDYYLSNEFLARISEKNLDYSISAMPIYLRKLIRVGNISDAERVAKKIEQRIFGEGIYQKALRFLGLRQRVPRQLVWMGFNTLALLNSTSGEDSKAQRYKKRADQSFFAKIYKVRQAIFDIEFAIYSGNYEIARNELEKISINIERISDKSEAVFLYTQLGDIESAMKIRREIHRAKYDILGDDDQFFDTHMEDEFDDADEDYEEPLKDRQRAQKGHSRDMQEEINRTFRENNREKGMGNGRTRGSSDGRDKAV